MAADKIDLARAADFAVGRIRISPSTCTLASGGEARRLEPLVMQTLLALLQRQGATVSREELIALCWDGRFVSDAAVARVISLLRRVCAELSPGDIRIETISKVGFRCVVGSRAEVGSRLEKTPRRLWRPPFGIFIATTGLVAVLLTATALRAGAGDTEIVPVEAGPSAPPTLERTADAATRNFTVALSDAGLGIKSSDGGRGAEFRLTSAVGQAGPHLRLQMNLVDRRSGRVLWADSVEAKQPGELVDGAATHLSHALRCAIFERERVSWRPGPPALAAYLETCAGLLQGRSERMLAASRKLVRLAPELGSGHALHAIAAARVADAADMSPDVARTALDEARAALEQAARLDPMGPKTHLAQAFVIGRSGEFAAREASLEKALEVDPDDMVTRIAKSQFLFDVGRWREATELSLRNANRGRWRGAARDPSTAVFLYSMGDIAGAERELARLRIDAPELYARARFTIAAWWLPPKQGLVETAHFGPYAASSVGRLCARDYLARLEQAVGTGLPSSCANVMQDWRVRMLTRQGDLEAAYRLARESLPRSRRRTEWLFYREMGAFRADPRFMRYAADSGLVAYWKASRRWPDFCSDPDLPYRCTEAASAL